MQGKWWGHELHSENTQEDWVMAKDLIYVLAQKFCLQSVKVNVKEVYCWLGCWYDDPAVRSVDYIMRK